MVKKKVKKTKDSKEDLHELKAQLARALADYDNLSRRVDAEREGFHKLASLSLVTKLLPIFDMLEEAQEVLNDSGLAIIIKEFSEVLLDEEIERIKVDKGNKFDENLHEAVEVVESKGENGEIVEEVLSGWRYEDGLVIRAAKVKVGKR